MDAWERWQTRPDRLTVEKAVALKPGTPIYSGFGSTWRDEVIPYLVVRTGYLSADKTRAYIVYRLKGEYETYTSFDPSEWFLTPGNRWDEDPTQSEENDATQEGEEQESD